MLKHVYLIFISTFLFGFIAGALLFFTSHMGQEGNGEIIGGTGTGYTVAVYVYGGCERLGCPSYRIAQDGSYIFITGNGERYTGTLPFDARREIGTLLASTWLPDVETSTFTGQCPIAYDGPAYRYDITYEDGTYHLDSCVHALAGMPLFDVLDRYLDTFWERHGESLAS